MSKAIKRFLVALNNALNGGTFMISKSKTFQNLYHVFSSHSERERLLIESDPNVLEARILRDRAEALREIPDFKMNEEN